MKILSKMIVIYRRVKWLGLYVFFLLSLLSCDTGFILPLDNNKFSHDILLSENRMVKVSSMYFNGWYYLLFNYNPNRSLDLNMYNSYYYGIVS
ncbi:hypothetical protein J5A58_08065 [Prevotella melaninogenica]|uniref:Lipoprotein n=1 Tax=Prevotella melaninogenica TaxID=28132 RepID=A0ABX7XTD1_9BACT|nr:hypothetical protein [Prevotella melaninogenica]QUB76710.1 hypothetical protein J5A58_08065 [Prevotella melaninogenica]